jgi:hypothetical protein
VGTLLALQEARKLLHNVPVVTKDWVETCMQRNKQVRKMRQATAATN